MRSSLQSWRRPCRSLKSDLSLLLKICVLMVFAALPLRALAGDEVLSTPRPTSNPATTPPSTRPGPPTGWSTELGAAVLVNPRFQGSSRYRGLAVPYIDARYRDDKGTLFFANVPQGIGGYLLRRGPADNRFSLSFAVAPGFANRDPDDIDGIDTFGSAAEARLRLSYQKRTYSLEATMAQALGSGHEGFYLDLAYNWRGRLGRGGFFSLGPSLRFGDGTYMGSLYDISGAESVASGLATFEAEQGVESLGFGGVVSLPVKGAWRFTTVMRYSRLFGDARDSSLTQDSNQVFLLAALTRRF